MQKTKIVCTIGPASCTPEALRQLIESGMDVARLNFSHGTHEEHGKVITRIREIAGELGQPVAILQDISGPKIRVGDIPYGPITLEADQDFILTSEPVPGSAEKVSISYPDLPREVAAGDTLLLSDGALELEVVETGEKDIRCRVIIGGPLSSHKGINLPTSSIRAPILTGKDEEDLLFGLEKEVDYVAVSFVRSAADVGTVRRFVRDRTRTDIPLIAKIEKHEALEYMDEIIEVADGIMVARGDLGVEIPLAKVPLVQKELIDRANRKGKLVITATQMLRSMVDSPRPTRAEVTDVANAILDGSDAVMLSEETAIGRYPRKAAAMMDSIAADVEAGFPYASWIGRFQKEGTLPMPEAVAHAACRLADDLDAAAIITCTTSGSTARQVAKHRPRQPILAPTPHEKTYRRLALVWGVVPLQTPPSDVVEQMMVQACEAALESGWVNRGQYVVITGGVPLNVPGSTNFIKAEVVQ